jgi:hypothetical protein
MAETCEKKIEYYLYKFMPKITEIRGSEFSLFLIAI